MKSLANKPIVFYLASFFLPLIIILAALAGLGVTPFGDRTLIISDANGLYVNYLSYAGRMFQGQEGLLYSFEKGLGGNMMPHLGGTLLNPFFVLFSFFDIVNFPQAFTWVSVLNFSLCGLTMYILLKDMYGHKVGNLIFSTTYALIGFNVANVFQVIFFTGVHALPIMVLGLRYIVVLPAILLLFQSDIRNARYCVWIVKDSNYCFCITATNIGGVSCLTALLKLCSKHRNRNRNQYGHFVRGAQCNENRCS